MNGRLRPVAESGPNGRIFADDTARGCPPAWFATTSESRFREQFGNRASAPVWRKGLGAAPANNQACAAAVVSGAALTQVPVAVRRRRISDRPELARIAQVAQEAILQGCARAQ
jgi:hypothetical protein